jgi:large subunit ribosomal protein L15e
MGIYKHIRDLWKNPSENLGELYKQRLVQYRTEPVTLRIDRPTRLDKARSQGYKAKQGFVLVRQRVSRGGRMRAKIRKGRRSKAMRRKKILSMNYQQVAEQRANKMYTNCEVLNSYYVGEDGLHYWYEVILIEKNHPNVLADPQLRNVANQTGRAFRGLTSAGRKARGLRNKGKGAEKIRPSLRSHLRTGN